MQPLLKILICLIFCCGDLFSADADKENHPNTYKAFKIIEKYSDYCQRVKYPNEEQERIIVLKHNMPDKLSEWPTIIKEEIKNIAKNMIQQDETLLTEVDQSIDGIFAIKAQLELHKPHMNLSKHHLNFTCFLNDVYSCVLDNDPQRFKIVINSILERHKDYAKGE